MDACANVLSFPNKFCFVLMVAVNRCRLPNPSKLVQQILWLSPEEQLEVYQSLFDKLVRGGLLAANGTILSAPG